MRRLFAHRQPDEELRKSEARYRTVLDAAFDAIVTITSEGIVRWFNRGAERIFGYSAEEIVGQSVTLLMPERYRELCVGGLHRYLRTGEARVVGGTIELVGLRKDGSEFPIEMSLGEILEGGERLFTGVIREVTERKRTEDALREARDRFRSIFDHAPIGVAMVSLEGRYLQVNRSLCEILGYTEEELQALTWQEITHPDDLAASSAHARRIVEGEFLRYHLEKRFLHANGHTVWASLSVSLVRDAEGEPLYFVSQIQDVTERKKVEKVIKESEKRFRSLVQYSSDIITILDADGTVHYVSPAVERVTGYRPEEQVGTNAFGSVHPDDREQALNTFAKVLKRPGLHPPLEFRVPHKDGSWRYLEHVVNNLVDDPSVRGVVITSRDVTERKEMDRKLREAEQRYRTLIERVPAVVYIQELGLPGSAMYMSPQIQTLTGYSSEECRDSDLRWRMVHPDDRERIRLEDERAGEPGEIFTTEYRVVHRDGRIKWVRNEAVVVEDEVSGTRYWQGFMLDITERKRFEEALERLSRRHEMVLESAGEGIFGLDLDGNATFINPAAASITRWEAEELVGRPQHEVLHHTKPDGSPYPREQCPIHAALEDGTTHSREDEVFWRKDGTSFPVEYMSSPIRQDGEVVGAVVTFKDITERKALEQQLHHQAFYDPLTGLPNRALFMERLEHALTRTRRGEGSVAVLLMDLDNFKLVNDSLGHEGGNELLAGVAQRLMACSRPEDTVARLGGDEYAILLEDV